MILTCNYEELTALAHGARAYLEEWESTPAPVKELSTTREAVELLLSRLDGDLSLQTLEDQIEVEQGVRAVVQLLREEVDSRVLAAHPADEDAVTAYFDFAHALTVLRKVTDVGDEMRALVELMDGGSPSERSVREFVFPD
jgi:hypothetical protein